MGFFRSIEPNRIAGRGEKQEADINMAKDDRVLIKVDRAKQFLAEAKSLLDVKQVMALADAARIYGKRINASKEVTNSAAELRLRAERQLGVLLAKAPKRTTADSKGGGSKGSKREPLPDAPPTLAESGLDKKTSSRAQQLAAVPESAFEAALVTESDLNPNRVVRDLTADRQKQTRDSKRKDAGSKIDKAAFSNVHVGDFRKLSNKVEDGSLSLIFTDPPYDRKAVELFDGLGKFAADKLCDGGSLLCYLGHIQLHEAMILLGKHLRFWWPICCLHSGKNALMKEYGIRVGWKPVLWYVKGTRDDKSKIVQDVMSGGQEKSHHDWQQSQSEAEYWIDQLCPKDGIVCDPFLGGGTTGAAAMRLNRQWIGFELDPSQASIAMDRCKP